MAKRESKKQVSPSLGDPQCRGHAARPKEAPPIFDAREWVQLTDAFVQVMSCVGRRDLAEIDINRDLRNGRLGSMKRSPDGTPTQLDPSDWQQWTVKAPLHPQEGVGVEPYVDGYVYVRRADLDKLYPRAGTPVAPQSNDTESSSKTTPAPEKQQPGIKPTKDWPNRLAPEMVRVACETPDLLRDRAKLVRHVRKFLADEIGWEPFDNKPLHRELDRLLSRTIK
jgi:hypothetical protein